MVMLEGLQLFPFLPVPTTLGSSLSILSSSTSRRLPTPCTPQLQSSWGFVLLFSNLQMVATGQEMVREKNSSRSGKCQGILFWVRENWHFEEKSGQIKIVHVILT